MSVPVHKILSTKDPQSVNRSKKFRRSASASGRVQQFSQVFHDHGLFQWWPRPGKLKLKFRLPRSVWILNSAHSVHTNNIKKLWATDPVRNSAAECSHFHRCWLQHITTSYQLIMLEYWHQRADERHGNLPQGNQKPLVVRVSKSVKCDIFPVSASTLLVGWQERHPGCKKLICWWWWLDWSFA